MQPVNQEHLERGSAVSIDNSGLTVNVGHGHVQAQNPGRGHGTPARGTHGTVLGSPTNPHSPQQPTSPTDTGLQYMQAELSNMSFEDEPADQPHSGSHDTTTLHAKLTQQLAEEQPASQDISSQPSNRSCSGSLWESSSSATASTPAAAPAHQPASTHVQEPTQSDSGSAPPHPTQPPVNLVAQYRKQQRGGSPAAAHTPHSTPVPAPTPAAASEPTQPALTGLQRCGQPGVDTPTSPSAVKRGPHGVWRYRLPGEVDSSLPGSDAAAAASAPTASVTSAATAAAGWTVGKQQQGSNSPSQPPDSPALHSQRSTVSVSPSEMMARQFNEDDPYQVLDESLKVLSEIEILIRESLDLEPQAALGQQGEGVLCQVPVALLDSLQETIGVILDSRAEIEGHTRRPRSTRSTRSHSPGAPYQHLSPYLQPLYPGGSAPGLTYQPRSPHAPPHTPTRGSPHITKVASSPSWQRPASAGSQTSSATTPVSKVRPTTASKATHSPPGTQHKPAGLGSPQRSVGQLVPSAGGYLYQRMQSRKAEQQEEANRLALEAYRKRHDTLHSPPPVDFIAAQAARQAEAHRRRIATMQADLVYIEQLRTKQSVLDQQHKEALSQAESALSQLNSHKTQAVMTTKWLQYQESMATGYR